MAAWIVVSVCACAFAATVCFYVLSVQPARLAARFGPAAYPLCARYRTVSLVALGALAAACVGLVWYPPPLPLPVHFPWAWKFSAGAALLLAAPGVGLIVCGMKDAGAETFRPAPEGRLFRGLYRYLRHPQSLGALLLWCAGGFLLHSPLLVLLTAVHVPVWVLVCAIEEKDLRRRYGVEYEAYRRQTGLGAFFRRRGRGGD